MTVIGALSSFRELGEIRRWPDWNWRSNDRDIGSRPGFEIQPVVVLRECEAWTVVARNSRNARVFGARYWREG
jgi:hypothetical protein